MKTRIVFQCVSKFTYQTGIEAILPIIRDSKKAPMGGYPHFINMRVYTKHNKLIAVEDYKKAWVIKKNKNGEVSSRKKSFVFGTLNFIARGGDNYPDLRSNPTLVDSGFTINRAMLNYVEQKKIMKSRNVNQFDRVLRAFSD